VRDIPFTTVQDVEKYRKNRAIILFGAGNIAEKTGRLLSQKPVLSIIDNASNHWGEVELGAEITGPDFLKTKDGKKGFIVICTTSFKEVSEQLVALGFAPMEDFIVSPILNDLRIISELESIEKRLLFTSGSPKHDDPKYGGGIYELQVSQDVWTHEKKINGNCYGLIRYGENFVSVDTERGIFEFDKNFKIIRSKEFPAGTRAHGLNYSEERKEFYIVGSYLDEVLILDLDFKIKISIPVSNKKKRLGSASHHCNDCFVQDSSLYVSMFSYSGNWKLDVFDGVVLEIDLTTQEIVGPVITGLWMPHNIKNIGGSLTVLDSLKGHLRKNNASIIGEFPAFTRGLDHDGMYYFIGQSRNRNFSKNLGASNNISIDAGIIIFDEYTKVSRFLQLPPKLSEIHSILLVK
jgi:hypothetical protein